MTGSVFRSVQRQVQFNPFKVTDDTTTNSVTKADVVQVVKAYGAMPGWATTAQEWTSADTSRST